MELKTHTNLHHKQGNHISLTTELNNNLFIKQQLREKLRLQSLQHHQNPANP